MKTSFRALRAAAWWALCLLAQSGATQAQIIINPPPGTLLINGTVEVAHLPCSEGGEFPPNWTRQLSFTEAPDKLCVRWSGKSPAASAKWELYKVLPGDDQKIASGNLPSSVLQLPSTVFQIGVFPTVPRFNTGAANQTYRLVVKSRKNLLDDKVYGALPSTLTHLPEPPPADAYACSTGPSRKVTLELTKMTVNQTSSTSGDGDRDELYVKVGRIGPGNSSNQKRLPGADDYYEAYNGTTVNENAWTNQDQSPVNNPVIWSGTLAHGQSALLSVAAQEQDNSDLPNIKAGIVSAMTAVAGVASAAGGPYGAAVAAVAGAVAGASEALIPNTQNHDFVGYVAARVTNHCGFVKADWVTFSSKNTDAGKVANQFLTSDTLENIESRLIVLDPVPQFWPNDVDWGPYQHLGTVDEFWWVASGTSASKYTFRLRTKAEAL
jgi:hypothetical protein